MKTPQIAKAFSVNKFDSDNDECYACCLPRCDVHCRQALGKSHENLSQSAVNGPTVSKDDALKKKHLIA